jgi:hypothetical protein
MASRKKRVTKRPPSRRPTSLESSKDDGALLWQRILIGFRGDSGSETGAKSGLTATARAAIEATFTEAALYYWTSAEWKSSIVPGGGSDVAGLAAFVTQQLNDGRKLGIAVEFRAETLAVAAASSLTEDDPVPVVKPDDVFCWYVGPTVWIDDATFQLMVVSGAEGDAESEPWRPDGRHPMLVRFVFDCPYVD